MKKIVVIMMGWALFHIAPQVVNAGAPHEVGGFTLGKQMSEYEGLIDIETLTPLRNSKFIREVETVEMEGFKRGLIWVGNCENPGRIMRIKLRYADPSKKFYKKLLKNFKKKFGDPSEWRGDPFHIVIAWKWSFVDENNNRISMILQHNTRDEDESIGNSVKLTMWNLIEEEKKCFEKKTAGKTKKSKKQRKTPEDWDRLIPR